MLFLTNMVTVAHLVNKNIGNHPFLQQALVKGIINYGALAEELKPEIEQELGKKIKTAAIMMALRRLAERIDQFSQKNLQLKEDLDITIKSNLASISVIKTRSTINSIKEIYKLVDLGEDMLTVTQGNREITVVFNQKYFSKIKQIFEPKNIKEEEKKLASLSINIPEKAIGLPGFYFLILRALAWDNINIAEAVSTFTELTLIMFEKDVTRGYESLRKLVS